ncbi:MAG: copper transporter [Syntrophomonadaceae bacterium]|nr:copper transporter [Syntrophomonadaceae bacterium]
MIDLRYHIATLIAIFLALGVGILTGSTVVGSDVLVDQQKKIIDQLERQFEILREREEELAAQNRFMTEVVNQYEDFNRAVLPPLVRNRLAGYRIAIVVTGGEAVPAGLLSSLSLAGAQVTSTTVILPGISLTDRALRAKLCEAYGLKREIPPEELRSVVSRSIGSILMNDDTTGARDLLQKNNLVKFNGDYQSPVDAIVVLGGTNSPAYYFPETIDAPIIRYFTEMQKSVYGVEVTQVEQSYMGIYQRYKITTVDDINIIPGQVALILAMGGESGDYGVKPTAKKFMPSLPPEYLGGV